MIQKITTAKLLMRKMKMKNKLTISIYIQNFMFNMKHNNKIILVQYKIFNFKGFQDGTFNLNYLLPTSRFTL